MFQNFESVFRVVLFKRGRLLNLCPRAWMLSLFPFDPRFNRNPCWLKSSSTFAQSFHQKMKLLSSVLYLPSLSSENSKVFLIVLIVEAFLFECWPSTEGQFAGEWRNWWRNTSWLGGGCLLTLAANNRKQILPKSLFPPFPFFSTRYCWWVEGRKGIVGVEGEGGASSEEEGNQVGKFKVKHGRTPPRNTMFHRFTKFI